MTTFFLDIKNDFVKLVENNKSIFVSGIVSIILGIVVGVACFNTNVNFYGILSASDYQIIRFIDGNVSSFDIFFNKVLEMFVLFAIITIFSLTIYTQLLNMLFLMYQTMVLTIIISVIAKVYGIAGILNIIFIILPTNMLWLSFILLLYLVLESRAREAHKYNQSFKMSVKESNVIKHIMLSLGCGCLICFVYSFIFPLILKCFSLIYY